MKLVALAWVTFREALRQKLAVNLLVFALLLTVASVTLSTLTFGEQYRIIADLALTAAQVFGTLISVFLGAALVAGDVARRTVYPILAKPVGRAEYLVGRYLGLLATVELNLAVMFGCTLGVLAVYFRGFGFLASTPLVSAFVGMGLQLAVVAAIAVAFSSVTNATLASIFSLSIAFAGNFSRDVVTYWTARGSAVRGLAYLLPNLSSLDFKVALVYQRPVAASLLAWGAVYTLLYVAAVLSVASAAFARRDFQ